MRSDEWPRDIGLDGLLTYLHLATCLSLAVGDRDRLHTQTSKEE